jgi:hypothetical protein
MVASLGIVVVSGGGGAGGGGSPAVVTVAEACAGGGVAMAVVVVVPAGAADWANALALASRPATATTPEQMKRRDFIAWSPP